MEMAEIRKAGSMCSTEVSVCPDLTLSWVCLLSLLPGRGAGRPALHLFSVHILGDRTLKLQFKKMQNYLFSLLLLMKNQIQSLQLSSSLAESPAALPVINCLRLCVWQ